MITMEDIHTNQNEVGRCLFKVIPVSQTLRLHTALNTQFVFVLPRVRYTMQSLSTSLGTSDQLLLYTNV